MRAELTDRLVRETPPPAKGYAIVWDTVQPGFGCRIVAPSAKFPDGARSFVVNYWASGRQRSLTIGSTPPWKAAEARREAKRIKLQVATGADPVAEKEADRKAPTINELADLYKEKHLPRKRPSSQRMDQTMLVTDILPALGHEKVAEIKHKQIADLHQKVAKRAPIMANRVVALLSKMFAISVKQGWRTDNPARGIERTQEDRRERFLTPDEIQRLMAVLDANPGNAANALKLLLWTGARKGELLTATWDQFDLKAGVWTKPAAATKQRKLHRVPLSQDALDVLKAIRQRQDEQAAKLKAEGKIAPPQPYVFPATRRKGQATQYLGKVWKKFSAEAGINDVRVHDLRHSHASLLASAGLSLRVIGQMLGHTQPATTARYAHLLDEPLRAAAEAVSKAISDARNAPAKVVQLKR